MEAGLPLRLQLTGSASGNPDLRLQLLSVNAGTACERVEHHQAPNQHNAVVAGVLCSLNPNIAHGHSWQQQHQQIRSCKYPYFLPNMGRLAQPWSVSCACTASCSTQHCPCAQLAQSAAHSLITSGLSLAAVLVNSFIQGSRYPTLATWFTKMPYAKNKQRE